MLATIVAMAIGASACSTGGGIKGIRMGVMSKSFIADIRGMVAPESAIIREKYHHVRENWLDDSIIKGAMAITIAYVAMYFISGLLGSLYGYGFVQALFEGVSAGSNTGLSCGVTSPVMPWVMKSFYILFMWMGRLEFISVFALIGYGYSIVRGK